MAIQYHFSVANDAIDVHTGKHASPSIIITMKEKEYLDLVNGKLNGQVAFMTGKLKITGDMGLALKLQNLFKTRSATDEPATTIQQVIDHSAESFNKDGAKGMTAVYQFDLTD